MAVRYHLLYGDHELRADVMLGSNDPAEALQKALNLATKHKRVTIRDMDAGKAYELPDFADAHNIVIAESDDA